MIPLFPFPSRHFPRSLISSFNCDNLRSFFNLFQLTSLHLWSKMIDLSVLNWLYFHPLFHTVRSSFSSFLLSDLATTVWYFSFRNTFLIKNTIKKFLPSLKCECVFLKQAFRTWSDWWSDFLCLSLSIPVLLVHVPLNP